MPITDTNIQKVIVNKLTQAQYATATKNPNEFYAVTDADNSEIEVVNVAANIHGTGTIIGTDWTEDDPYNTGNPNRAYIYNLTADKTYAEVLALINAGKKVYAKVNLAAFTASGFGNFPWIGFPGDYYVELTTSDTADSILIGSIKIENLGETVTLSVAIALDNGNTTANLILDSDFLWAWNLYYAGIHELNTRLDVMYSAPTSSTPGEKGGLIEVSSTGKLYICTAKTAQGTTPETYTYTWEEVQTGTSDVMMVELSNITWDTPPNPGLVEIASATANKTFAQIDAAFSAGKRVIFKLPISTAHAPIAIATNYYAEITQGEGGSGGTYMAWFSFMDSYNFPTQGIIIIDDSSSVSIMVVDTTALAIGAVDELFVTGSTAPTSSTVATGGVGTIYKRTSNGELYVCTAKTAQGTTPETYAYTWERLAKASELPNFTMTTTDPGEGQPLAANNFIAVYAA